MSSEVTVASAGTVERDDRCAKCGGPMMYRLDPERTWGLAMFCGSQECPAWCEEVLPCR